MPRSPASRCPFPSTTVSSSRPILLITLDTFRADRIGAYGYQLASTPNLDRLAREGVRFADATTRSPLTGPAHTALLTGQYPTRLGVRNNAGTALPDSAATLAEILRESGYRTGGFIGAFVLDRQYGFAQGFDVFDATFSGYRAQKGTSSRIAATSPREWPRSSKRRVMSGATEDMAARRADAAIEKLKKAVATNERATRSASSPSPRGDLTTAAAEYRRALGADPSLRAAADGLQRVTKR